jgi:hypothetical protein
MNGVHRRCTQSNDEAASVDQRERFLLFDCAVRDGPQDLRIKTGVACQLLSIDLITLPITVRDRPQLPNVGHNHLMAEFLQRFADPDRMGSRPIATRA